jgi:hypothetical protein
VHDRRHHATVGRRVTAQLVRDHTSWRTALPFQQLSEEAFGGSAIASRAKTRPSCYAASRS